MDQLKERTPTHLGAWQSTGCQHSQCGSKCLTLFWNHTDISSLSKVCPLWFFLSENPEDRLITQFYQDYIDYNYGYLNQGTMDTESKM